MICVSTSYIASKLTDGVQLAETLLRLPVSCVELEYRVTPEMFDKFRRVWQGGGKGVSSIHNYFPLPPMASREQASGDLFLLSSPDREERERAIEWSLRTIEHADQMEARVVVLHCGRVEMEEERNRLVEFFEKDRSDSEEAQEFIASKLGERESKRAPFLDGLRFSLERLAKTAEKYDIALGLENRNHFHELPGPEEFGLLFQEFDGAPLGYWHDTGHAWLQERLGFGKAVDLLERYGDRLVGVHLHDVKDLRDHLPPGEGDADFSQILPHLKDGVLCVLELRSGTSEERLLRGLEHLYEVGIG